VASDTNRATKHAPQMEAMSDESASFERMTRARPAQIRRCGAHTHGPATTATATDMDRVPRALTTVGGRASSRVGARQQLAHVGHIVSEEHVVARVVPRIIVNFHHAPIAFGANQIRTCSVQKSTQKI
jgi:hypothetical protein